MCKKYTNQSNKEYIRQTLNYYSINKIVAFASKVINKNEDIYIPSKENFISLLNDTRYHIGLFESINIAKQLNVGLILFTKNKSDPKKSIHMQIDNHSKIILRNENSDEYLFIYANEKSTYKMRLVVYVNPYDDNDLVFIHSLSNSKVVKEGASKKFLKHIYQSKLPPALEYAVSIYKKPADQSAPKN